MVGQNRIHTPYMTVYDRDFPAKNAVYIHRIYLYGYDLPYLSACFVALQS
jgi:hypothetical protein